MPRILGIDISNYGSASSDNYGAHTLRVTMGSLTVWFSYDTPVAFAWEGAIVVRENPWGPTTGKHLTLIDGGSKEAKKRRVSGEVFEDALEKALSKFMVKNLETEQD